MKVFVFTFIISSVFLGCGNKLTVSGQWKNGGHELQLTPYNKFILSTDDSTKFSGVYAIVFDKMQFINTGNGLAEQCMRPGRYSFTLVNDTLQLTMQDDPCTERKFMLNGAYWQRIH